MPAPSSGGPPTHVTGKDAAQTPPTRYSINELIDEAEQLRVVLQDAGVRQSRLLGALKAQKRQSRVMLAAM